MPSNQYMSVPITAEFLGYLVERLLPVQSFYPYRSYSFGREDARAVLLRVLGAHCPAGQNPTLSRGLSVLRLNSQRGASLQLALLSL
jgi:hypothetical protein